MDDWMGIAVVYGGGYVVRESAKVLGAVESDIGGRVGKGAEFCGTVGIGMVNGGC